MAIMAIGRNGIGLGHQSRIVALCEALFDIGQVPILLVQGQSRGLFRTSCPISPCPYLSDLSPQDRINWKRNVENYALLSDPAVVIEDTHPMGIHFSPSVRRLLLVRPLTFSPMMDLLATTKSDFDHYLIADAPGTPTWPYQREQTRTIETSQRLTIIGPIYRRPYADEIASVRRRYHYRRGEDICLFSMGGGGDHAGATDAEHFIVRALEAGQSLRRSDPKARLVFVKGPLFPEQIAIPSIFEVVEVEPNMPALFKLARAAMIRLGFNSVWESIAGSTPIIPFRGTSYQEPMEARRCLLMQNNLAFDDVVEAWEANRHGDYFESTTRQFSQQWPGKPDPTVLEWICRKRRPADNGRVPQTSRWFPQVGSRPSDSPFDSGLELAASEQEFNERQIDVRTGSKQAEAGFSVLETAATSPRKPPIRQLLKKALSNALLNPNAFDEKSSPFMELRKRPELVVRIDDVVEVHDAMKEFIEFALKEGIPLALEVIPLHCRITGGSLSSLGLCSSTVEIGQHGYSHLPFDGFDSESAEFNPYLARPTMENLECLRTGKVMMQQRFGSLFCGGYSAPYDRLAPWVAEAWHQLDGKFLSFIWERPNGARQAAVKVPVEVWNWRTGKLCTTDELLSHICETTTRAGYTGLVLHQQHFLDAEYLDSIKKLLLAIIKVGFHGVSLSSRALFQASTTTQSEFRVYDRGAITQ
jgi:hypothetical protein